MSNKKKIIMISPGPFKIEDADFKSLTYKDWAKITIQEIAKYTDDYELEQWVVDSNAKKQESVTKNGITYRRFPYLGLPSSIAQSRGVSFSLLNELGNEIKNNDVILHLHFYASCYTTYLILALYGKKVPIVCQHHGSTHPLALIGRKPIFLLASPLLLLEELYESIFFKRVSRFFVLTQQEKKDLSRWVNPNKIEISPMAVDFNTIRPVNKASARSKLKIPKNSKVILYISRYHKAKGIDSVLESLRELKKRDKSIILVAGGGSKNDEFYDLVKKEAELEAGWISREDIKYYLSSADLYVMYSNKTVTSYGGMSVAPMEALACNTPLVSTNLIHFPGKEWKKLGMIPHNKKELTEAMWHVLNNRNKYTHCREIAKKYFDWSVIAKHTIDTYKKILKSR